MSTSLGEMTQQELADFAVAIRQQYDALGQTGLHLDLTRGKPSSEQLDLSDELLRLPTSTRSRAGVDVRNYGGLQGLDELREIFADLLWVEPAQIVAGGNSSLSMMKETLLDLILFGGVDSPRPWREEKRLRFICPVPGYDRHFTLLESLGIEMVTVPLREDGPDVPAVKELVRDPSVKGMWIVPTYANPSGSVCSHEVASELVAMETAAPDFKILWDNAYAFHHLTEEEAKSADVISLASAAGHPHRPIMFASTSKITYAGAGVAFLAASRDQVAWYLGHLGTGSIGPDKVNQLRHAEFFGDAEGVRRHMLRHREIIWPKFEAVQRILAEDLGSLGIAEWTHPTGGYFVSLDVVPGTAARVVELAKMIGVALTPAGSSFPYKSDPENENIRLAPTFPPLEEVESAMRAVTVCVRLAAIEELAPST